MFAINTTNEKQTKGNYTLTKGNPYTFCKFASDNSYFKIKQQLILQTNIKYF